MQKTNPVKLFLILSLSAFLLGTSLKNFLQSQFLNKYIASKLLVVSSKTTKFTYKRFKLYVSHRHLLPSLVLQVDNPVFSIPDKCRSQLIIKAQKILSPVNLVSALWYRKNIQLGLLIDNLAISKEDFNCPSNKTLAPTASLQPESENFEPLGVVDKPKKDIRAQLKKALEKVPELSRVVGNISKKIDHIQVGEISFKDLSSKKNEMVNFNLRDVSISFDNGNFDLKSSASWPFYTVADKALFFPTVKAKLNQGKLKLSLLAQLKEGHVALDAETGGRSEKITLVTKLRQLPVDELTKLINKVLSKKWKVNPVLSWVSCQFRVSSTIANLLDNQHQLSNCQVVGELGEWTMTPYKMKLQPIHLQTNPVYFSVKKARIEKVLRLLNLPVKKSMFSKHGLFSGQIKYLPSSQKWDLIGEIKNLELRFSKQGNKVNQPIKSMQVKTFGHKDSFDILVNNIIFDQGIFDGEIKYHHSSIDKVGSLSAKLKRLSFRPSLQKLYLGGVVPYFRGHVVGSVQGQRWALHGQLSADSFKTDYALNKNLGLNLNLKNRSLSGEILIEDMKLLSGIYKHKDLSLRNVISPPELQNTSIKNLKIKFEYSKDSLIWKAKTSDTSPGGENLKISSFGTFYSGKGLLSKISFFNSVNPISWKWQGPPGAYKLTLENFKPNPIAASTKKGKKTSLQVTAGKNLLANNLEANALRYQQDKKTSLPARIIKRAKEILPLKGR